MKIYELLKAFKFLWKTQKTWILFSFLISIVLGVLPLGLIWLTKELVNSVSALINSQISYQLPLVILLIQFGLILMDSILRHLKGYLDNKVLLLVDHDLNFQIVQKLNSTPFYIFEKPDFYNHIERVQQNSGTKFISPINSCFLLFEALITLVGLLTFLFSIHFSLGILSIVLLIPVFIVKTFFGSQKFWLNLYMTPIARQVKYINRLLTERQFSKEIRVFNLNNYLTKKWSDRYQYNAQKSLNLLKRSKRAEIGLDGVSAFFYSLAAGIIIWLANKSLVKIGEFVAISQAVQNTQNSIAQIASSIAAIYEDSLYINDYFTFMEFEVYQEPNLELKPFPTSIKNGITLNNVSFRYPDSDKYALKNISFHVNPGEKIGIVGLNGSGKSTLVKCLLNLYPVTEGEIIIDNEKIQSFNNESFSRNITTIFQDFNKYWFSAAENIAYSDISKIKDKKKIKEAALKAGIHHDIEKLPNSYDTNLGRFLNDGVDLSGGQWQRIALARALFKDSQILILDEPTSALDPEVEQEFLNQFNSASNGKTTFFISHKMAIGKLMDRILVMKNGELVEYGSHKELMKLNGEYARLYTIQSHLIRKELVEIGG